MPREELQHFRRYHGYDYSRGAVVFATFHLEPRQPLFGRIENGRMVYSAVGRIAAAVIEKESRRTRDAQLKSWVVMPDHIHLRLYLPPGQAAPLKKLGQFIYNVKAWTRNNAQRELGVTLGWQTNYHDWLCLSREIIETVDKYIANNPLKWSLMHGPQAPLRLIEPVKAAVLPRGEWWTAAGNVGLLDGKIAAVRLSRSIPAHLHGDVTARLMAAVEKGFILAGTWISPCEREVFAQLVKRGAAVVRASQDPLAMVYRPKGDEPQMFARGNYLVLSRVAAPGTARGVGWHGINDALNEIARAGGGLGVYVKGEGGRLLWCRAG